MATGRVDAVLVVGGLFFLIPYNLAMYGINDVFDYASDILNTRKGGVEGALTQTSQHRGILWASALVPLPFVVWLLAVADWPSRAVLLVSLFAVVAYSAPPMRFKEVPFLDSLTSAAHFVTPLIFGLTMAGADWTAPLVLLCAAFTLWAMASQAFGAVQDIIPDREGGLASIATVLGAQRTVRWSILLYAAASVCLLFSWPAARWAAVIPLFYVLNTAPFWSVRDEHSGATNTAWQRFLWINYLSGFLVTVLLILVRLGWA
jgi:4-hydroxybenzoate polyprenyltransferase